MGNSTVATVTDNSVKQASEQAQVFTGSNVGSKFVTGNLTDQTTYNTLDGGAVSSSFGFGSKALDMATAAQSGALSSIDRTVATALAFAQSESERANRLAGDFGTAAFDLAQRSTTSAAQGTTDVAQYAMKVAAVLVVVIGGFLLARKAGAV